MLQGGFDFRGRTTQIYTFLTVLEGSSGPAWVHICANMLTVSLIIFADFRGPPVALESARLRRKQRVDTGLRHPLLP